VHPQKTSKLARNITANGTKQLNESAYNLSNLARAVKTTGTLFGGCMQHENAWKYFEDGHHHDESDASHGRSHGANVWTEGNASVKSDRWVGRWLRQEEHWPMEFREEAEAWMESVSLAKD
jgi:hypothetical protein